MSDKPAVPESTKNTPYEVEVTAPSLTGVRIINPTLYRDPNNPDALSFTPFPAASPVAGVREERHDCRCSDCGHMWISRGEPTGCPNCKGSGTVSFNRIKDDDICGICGVVMEFPDDSAREIGAKTYVTSKCLHTMRSKPVAGVSAEKRCSYCGRVGGFHEQQCYAPVLDSAPAVEKAKLKPCPFCGTEPCGVTRNKAKELSFVECDHCEIEGPSREFRAQAVAAWNWRAQPEGDGWIAVTPETMPEVNDEVWAWLKFGEGLKVGEREYADTSWLQKDGTWALGSAKGFTVTHWRPLPSPPVGEKP